MEEQPVQRLDLRVRLEALGPRLPDVADLRAERRQGHDGEQVLELVPEVRGAESHASLPQLLVGPGLPAPALLGLRVHVAERRTEATREVREEEVVEGGRAEALAVRGAQPGAG